MKYFRGVSFTGDLQYIIKVCYTFKNTITSQYARQKKNLLVDRNGFYVFTETGFETFPFRLVYFLIQHLQFNWPTSLQLYLSAILCYYYRNLSIVFLQFSLHISENFC